MENIYGTTSGQNVGSYTATFTLKNTTNTQWSDGTTAAKNVTWSIGAYNLSNATIAAIAAQTFTGSAITPAPSVTVPLPSGSTTTLTKDTDYTVSYSNNINAGTATATISAGGASAAEAFVIDKAEISCEQELNAIPPITKSAKATEMNNTTKLKNLFFITFIDPPFSL